MKRALLLFVILPLLAGCSGDDGNNGAVTLSVIGDRGAVIGPATAQGLVAFDADGQIEPALAERWIVSDDGLSLDFRIAHTNWANGKPVSAIDVAHSLQASFMAAGHGRLGALFTAVKAVVPMTDQVVEIQLKEPRPNLLQLLAQPEFSIRHNGVGTGPYSIRKTSGGVVTLRPLPSDDTALTPPTEEQLAASSFQVRGEGAAQAVDRYVHGKGEAVLGGSFTDYPLVRAAQLRPTQMVIDPVRGLFGLAFVGHNQLTSAPSLRAALSMAIDRQGLANDLGLPGWYPRDTILPAQLDSAATPQEPDWGGGSLDERRAEARRRMSEAIASLKGKASLRIALPAGQGAQTLFAHIAADWQSIGITAVAVGPRDNADLRLIDEVAPSDSVNWYFTRLSCDAGLPCDQTADAALKLARKAKSLDARAQAYTQIDIATAANTPFIVLGNPFRWNLTSARLPGLRPSIFGVHPLLRLKQGHGQ